MYLRLVNCFAQLLHRSDLRAGETQMTFLYLKMFLNSYDQANLSQKGY